MTSEKKQTPAETVIGTPDLVDIIAKNAGLPDAAKMARANHSLHLNIRDVYRQRVNDITDWMKEGTLVDHCCHSHPDYARIVLHNPNAYGINLQEFFEIALSHSSLRKFITQKPGLHDNTKRSLAVRDFNMAVYYLTNDPELFSNTQRYWFKDEPYYLQLDEHLTELQKLFQSHPNLVYWCATNPKVCKSLPWNRLVSEDPITNIALEFAELGKNPFNLKFDDWLNVYRTVVPDGRTAERIRQLYPPKPRKVKQSSIIPETKRTFSSWWSNFFPAANDNKDSKGTQPEVKMYFPLNPASTSHASGGTSTTSSRSSLPPPDSEPETFSLTQFLEEASDETDDNKEVPKETLSGFLTTLEDNSKLSPREKNYVTKHLKTTAPQDGSDGQTIGAWINTVDQHLKQEKLLKPIEAANIVRYLREFQKQNFSAQETLTPAFQ